MTKVIFECPFELVAIDLDGTLVDSVGDLDAAVSSMLNSMALQPAAIEDVRQWVGNGVERLVHRALTRCMDADAEKVQFKSALELFQKAYQSVNGQQSRLYPDVAQGLDWLATLDTPMVLITNKAARFAYPLLDSLKIDHFFDFCIAGDEVATKKPDPAALLQAANRCQANPRRSVLIGDSISDIKAARAARFSSISVSYGYNHGESVRLLQGALKSDAIIDSFSELPAVFKHMRM
jgi:phosphoglycolate phosphatase